MHAKSFAFCNGLFTVEYWFGCVCPRGRLPSRTRLSLISAVPVMITATLRKSGCLHTTSCFMAEKIRLSVLSFVRPFDRSQGGSIGVAIQLRVRGSWVRITVWSGDSSSSANRSRRLWGPPSLSSVGPGASILTTNRHLPPMLRMIRSNYISASSIQHSISRPVTGLE